MKDNKSKPVRDEYEYVSDEGELKIDEFPIRRKKNSGRRDQSCEYRPPQRHRSVNLDPLTNVVWIFTVMLSLTS